MNRKTAICLILLPAMAAGAILLAGFAVMRDPAVVRTRALEVVDGAGRRRAMLPVSDEGTASVTLLDAGGRPDPAATGCWLCLGYDPPYHAGASKHGTGRWTWR